LPSLPVSSARHIPAAGLYTYPDVLVTCGPERFLDNQADTLLNPVLIIEVLSEGTKNYDMGSKFESYRSIPSLQEYLTVEQGRIGTTHWVRQENNQWLLREWRDSLDAIQLASAPTILKIADVYDNVWDQPEQ
jgi:Uma2 family endonuclease